MNGEPFRGFESHPLRHKNFGLRIANCGFGIWNLRSAVRRSATQTKMISSNRKKTVRSKLTRALSAVLLSATTVMSCFGSRVLAQKRRAVQHLSVCGNPNLPCKTSATFEANDLPFRVPKNAVIYDTELFYAIVLKTVGTSDQDCEVFVPESERTETQRLFPDHKVFASRCPEPGNLSYSNTSSKHRFMAVYAGTTLAEANRMLAAVKATGKFTGANIRRMRTGFNGT